LLQTLINVLRKRIAMAESPSSAPKSQRLLSIDALRGFDMFFISGGAVFLYHLQENTSWAWMDTLGAQMKHPAWNGFTFYDLIFPLFLFISGVSLSFSIYHSQIRNRTKVEIYKKALRRMVILIILGIIYKNAPLPLFEPSQIRYGSVLGRIGIACFITTLIYLNFTKLQSLLWLVGILVSYYAALFLIPVPGFGAGDLSFEGNLVGWVDRHFMPGRLLQGTYDELAILTQFPALCLTMMGTWAGDLLREQTYKSSKKLQILILGGGVAIGIGLAWGLHFPINKHLWSSSFILLTGGLSCLMLALFYGLIDVLHYKRWAFFFKVIGLNSLVIYFANSFINFEYTAKKLFGGLLNPIAEQWHSLFLSIAALGLLWGFLYLLYRNKIFVKV